MGGAVIAQCPTCRSLGLVGAVIVDGSRDADGAPRAGLTCGVCGAVAWLPLQTTVAAPNGAATPSWPSLPGMPTSLPPPSLPPPSSLVNGDGTAAVPVAASPAVPPSASTVTPAPTVPTAMTGAFDDETLGRIRARIDSGPAPAESQQVLAERFDALLTTRWANEAEHKAVLKMAAVAGELAFVGGRYRAVLDVVRDEPRARAAQGELLTMAMATMSTTREAPAPSSAGRLKLVAAVVVLLAVGGGVYWFMRKMLASMAAGGGLD